MANTQAEQAAPRWGASAPRPIPWWPLGLSVALGGMAGVGSFTFAYAEGLSYFSKDPEACVNCHIMQPQYDAWQQASHHTVAVCVDCHLPQAFVPKYLAKAENGWRHGQKFTTGKFEEPIYVKQAGLGILQENCERCHAELVDGLTGHGRRGQSKHPAFSQDAVSDAMYCIHCHWSAGHGERAGLGGPLQAWEVGRPSLPGPGARPR